MYFDSHVHLNDDALFVDVDAVIHRAREAGVTRMVCVGWDAPSSERAVAIAAAHEGVYAAVGLHPEMAHEATEADFERVERLLVHPKVVAVGETGLDRYWDKTKVEVQTAVFVRQLELASRYRKPVVIHMREATAETLEILRTRRPAGVGGVMHCYGGSAESVHDFLALGFYVSFAGPVSFKNARVPKEVAAIVPDDRLLIETDAPYLAPDPHRGKTNESAYVPFVAAAVARIRGRTQEDIGALTAANAARLFGLSDR